LAQEFSKAQLNIVHQKKLVMTSPVFAVFQRFRVEGDLNEFLRDLKRAVQLVDNSDNISNRSQCSSSSKEDI
jgi:hypothetical protein